MSTSDRRETCRGGDLISWVKEIREEDETPSTLSESADAVGSEQTASQIVDDAAPTPYTDAASKILFYLNQRGYQMVSFERIRKRVNPDYDNDFLNEVLRSHNQTFRPATLKGGKPGMAKL